MPFARVSLKQTETFPGSILDSRRIGLIGGAAAGKGCERQYVRSAALLLGGHRRHVGAEIDSSLFAVGFCFHVAAPSCGGRPHLGQSDPGFTLRLLMSQLGSKHTFAMSIGERPSGWISGGSSGRDRLLDPHRFRPLDKLVVGNLDRIADVDDVGD
jgi:hypothetical protein